MPFGFPRSRVGLWRAGASVHSEVMVKIKRSGNLTRLPLLVVYFIAALAFADRADFDNTTAGE